MAPEAAARILFIPNGVDVERFSEQVAPAARARPYVLAVGRLDRQKGFDLLVEAMARLGAAGGAPDLLLAGDGPGRSALEAQVARLALGERVHFAGAVGADEVAALYRAALLVAAPSRWEGLPLVCLEALACGAPIVAANVDGMSDVVVHDETGVLVPPEDVDALAAAITALLADPTRRARLAAAGRDRVRRQFTWAVVARRYLEVLEAARHST
ncbi:MAG: glycosyltransferase [Candidatus Binatia bacterium]